MRRFVAIAESADSQSSNTAHVDIATRYFEKIAGDTYDKLSRIFSALPPLEVLQNMRVSNTHLQDIACISFTSDTVLSITVKSRSMTRPIIDSLMKLDPHWKVTQHSPDLITITVSSQTPANVEQRVSQVRQVVQGAKNSITERRTNIIKQAKLEIRDIGHERDVIAKIVSLADKFKQAVERIEEEKVTCLRK